MSTPGMDFNLKKGITLGNGLRNLLEKMKKRQHFFRQREASLSSLLNLISI